VDLAEVACGGVNWIHVAEVLWRAVVNTNEPSGCITQGCFLTS